MIVLDLPLLRVHAQNFFKKRGYSILDSDSIITWDSEKNFNLESKAVFRIIYFLGGFWRLFFIFNILLLL